MYADSKGNGETSEISQLIARQDRNRQRHRAAVEMNSRETITVSFL